MGLFFYRVWYLPFLNKLGTELVVSFNHMPDAAK